MEAGPRFELRLYQIKLGTIEQSEVQNEYVLRPYQNSAKRRKVMGEDEPEPAGARRERMENELPT